MHKVFPYTFGYLFRIFLIGLVFLPFHFLAPHSYAFQPTVGAWTLVGLNNQFIASVAVDPNNPNILYAGTDTGIFKSTDGGDNWSAVNNGLPSTSFIVYGLAINPQNSNTLYAALYGAGVFKSTDGGANWTDISDGTTAFSKYYLDMVLDPNNPDTVYVGIYQGNGVWKTTNGGASWTNPSPSGDVYGMEFDPVNSYVYAGTNTVAKSIDGGTTWTGFPNLNPGGGIGPIAIDPNDPNTLYAGGGGGSNDGAYKSTDGTVSWTKLSSYPGGSFGPGHPMVTDPIRPNTVYAASRDAGHVYQSTNGGTSWSELTGGLPTNQGGIHPLLMPANNHNILYASTNVGLYAYGFNNPPTAPIVNPIPNKTISSGATYTASGSFTESGATSWTATVDYGDGSGAQPLTLSGMNFSLNHTYNNSGIYKLIVTVTDNQGASGTKAAFITVDNPPVVSQIPNATINQGDTYSAASSFTDPDSTSWTARVDYGDGSGSQPLTLNGTNFTLTHPYTTAGTYTVTVSVTDNQGVTGTGIATITVNARPHINPLNGATINEGGTYTENGSFSDPDSTNWTATVDYGDSSGSQSLPLSGTNFSLSHVYKDNGTYTVTVSVTDNQGATGTGTATVTVNNVNPSVGTITAPSSPVLVNTAIAASANFTDPGVLDTHTASWNWGDGNTTTGTVTESNGSGSVSNNHTYITTGVYTITSTVTDKDGGQGTSTFQYVAVYDSSTSFAGGRSFDNPLSASPNTSGKVSFGISSKYTNSNVLTGSVKMNFKAANLDFASISLQSLATSNGKAYLKGSGTLNGSGNYTFLATGIDGSVAGGSDLIRFQIKDASNNVIYDSQPGASDTTDPTTVVATGNIRVH